MATKYSDERRSFLKTLALISGAAASVSLSRKTAAGTSEIRQLSEKTGQGYRETEHVSKYYRSARV